MTHSHSLISEFQRYFALVTKGKDCTWQHPPKFRNSQYHLNSGKIKLYFSIKSFGCIVLNCSKFILEMLGELYKSHEMPEQPKDSFLKGLFGGGAKSLNREELCKCNLINSCKCYLAHLLFSPNHAVNNFNFNGIISVLVGEQGGKANRSVAKQIPAPNLDQIGQRASTAASEISRAHQLAMERGEKLNLLEERAERLANLGQEFSTTTRGVLVKYRDKKWYQL